MGEQHDRIAGVLPRTDVKEDDLAPAQADGHTVPERDVGDHMFSGPSRIQATPLEFILVIPSDDAGGLGLGNDDRAFALEDGVAEIVVPVVLTVDDPFDGGGSLLPDLRQQRFGGAPIPPRVDDQHPFLRDQHGGVGPSTCVVEVEIRDDLYEREGALRLHRRPVAADDDSEEQRQQDRTHHGHAQCHGASLSVKRIESQFHAQFLAGRPFVENVTNSITYSGILCRIVTHLPVRKAGSRTRRKWLP